MAACSRSGVSSARGSLAARAASILARQASSWVAKASSTTGTPTVLLAARPLDVGRRNHRHGWRRLIVIEKRQLRRHRAADPRAAQRDLQRLQRVGEGIVHGRALEAAVCHAVVALAVASHTVALPVGLFHQRAVALGVALI